MKKKLLYFGIFLAVIGVLLVFDLVRASLYNVEFVDIQPTPGIADGNTEVTLTVQVTRGGTPQAGHDLYIISRNGGKFAANRVRSDEQGCAVFTYYPYLATKTTPLTNVSLVVRDESNSIFMEVNAEGRTMLEMIESDTDNSMESEEIMSGIFGD